MGYAIQQNQTAQPLVFLLVQSSDHITGLTGATPTVTISKNGSAFAAPAGAVSEIGNGWYKVAGNATDSNTLGPLLLHASATSSDPVDECFPIVAFNSQDAVHLGLSALPNAVAAATGGLPTIGTGAGQINTDGTGAVPVAFGTALPGTPTAGSVGEALKLADSLAFTGGNVHADLRDIVGVAVSTTTAQLGVNAVQYNAQTTQTDANGLPKVDVADWAGTAVGGAPPTAAAVATAVWQDLTASSDFTTAGSIGKLLVTDIDAAISSRTSGNVTVGGYAAGEDPATLVLGATASSWNTAGTIGQKINAAGGAADPLTNAVPGSYAAGTAGYVLGTYLNASVSAVKAQTDKLVFDASNFVKSDPQTGVNVVDWGGVAVGGMPYSGTPPTTAAIATAVWQDLTASADFGTAGSIGALLKTDIDAAISSRLATSGYTAPPTAASIATAVLTDTTDVTTQGSIGYILAHNFAGMLTSVTSSVYSSAALANAPSGSVTVAGYAAGEDPATLVWNAVAASFNSAGTMGQKLNAAGGAADPLTNQVPGTYASGTAGAALGKIGVALIQVTSPIAQNGDVSIVAGDSYKATDGRAITFVGTGWPNLTGSTVTIEVYGVYTTWSHSLELTTVGGSTQTLTLELTTVDTNAAVNGTYYLRATLSDGDVATLATAQFKVDAR